MTKHIAIIGGGISGLTVLHYLKRGPSADSKYKIRLFEKNETAGGTIRTINRQGCLFETGPNGFLSSKPSTLALAHELGISDKLVPADPRNKKRYVCLGDRLFALPTGPLSFAFFQGLGLKEKIRILKEFFIPGANNPDETVFEFGKRRLGEGFARKLLDPMVNGIFGGDAKELNLKACFPKIYGIEQNYGSLWKGMFALARGGQPSGKLWSFSGGMGTLPAALAERYAADIQLSSKVSSISMKDQKYQLFMPSGVFEADELIVAVPSHTAWHLLRDVDAQLADLLKNIQYAPVMVACLTYERTSFDRLPRGFGYLRSSSEGRRVLGTLFSWGIFPDRGDGARVNIQVMIGGAHHPGIINLADPELLDIAHEELECLFRLKKHPVDGFVIRWDKAIPQYDRNYPGLYHAIHERLLHSPRLHLLANYLDGISVNDCVENAQKLASRIHSKS